jgi:uncharacterized membrane protein YcaP (DUF421 family)
MSDAFDLSMPWYAFAVRGAVCYLGLLALLRLTGKRSFGEMSPFDIVVLILVGGVLRSATVGKDTSLLGPFIAIATILALDALLARLGAMSPAFDRLLEGRSVLLARRGAIEPGALVRHSISQAAFERELRAHQIHSVEEADEARLEANGRLTVFKRTNT